YAWICLFGNVFKRHGRGDLEGQLRGVHLMIRAIIHRDLHVDNRIASDDPMLHSLYDTSLHSWDVLLGDNPTNNRILKDKTFPTWQWCQAQLHMPILSASATLADKFSLAFCRPTNGLFVGNLRTRHISRDLELSRQPIHQNLQMEFSHT